MLVTRSVELACVDNEIVPLEQLSDGRVRRLNVACLYATLHCPEGLMTFVALQKPEKEHDKQRKHGGEFPSTDSSSQPDSQIYEQHGDLLRVSNVCAKPDKRSRREYAKRPGGAVTDNHHQSAGHNGQQYLRLHDVRIPMAKQDGSASPRAKSDYGAENSGQGQSERQSFHVIKPPRASNVAWSIGIHLRARFCTVRQLELAAEVIRCRCSAFLRLCARMGTREKLIAGY
jgi:hypothetical protein